LGAVLSHSLDSLTVAIWWGYCIHSSVL